MDMTVCKLEKCVNRQFQDKTHPWHRCVHARQWLPGHSVGASWRQQSSTCQFPRRSAPPCWAGWCHHSLPSQRCDSPVSKHLKPRSEVALFKEDFSFYLFDQIGPLATINHVSNWSRVFRQTAASSPAPDRTVFMEAMEFHSSLSGL